MSVSGKETAVAGGNALRNCDGEDDRYGNQRKKNRSHHVGKFTRAKQVLLCSSFPRDSNRRPTSSRDEGVAANQRCLFCISRPGTLESPVELRASDRSDPTSTHEVEAQENVEKASGKTHEDMMFRAVEHTRKELLNSSGIKNVNYRFYHLVISHRKEMQFNRIIDAKRTSKWLS